MVFLCLLSALALAGGLFARTTPASDYTVPFPPHPISGSSTVGVRG